MGKLLEIKTVQTGAFRILIESVKEILSEANFEFSPTGIRLQKTNHSNTILVYLKLNAENFDSYYCKEKINVGISMINFFKLIKTMGNNDTLTLSMDDDDTSKLSLIIENTSKKSTTHYKLNLLDINENEFEITPTKYPSVITMPSQDFQKICRDMHNLSDKIEIKTVKNQIQFYCKGDFAECEKVIRESDSGMNFSHTEQDTITQGMYSLSSLVLFTKCTNLCNSIQLYFKNDFMLTVKYSCANLGEIKFCLAEVDG